MPRLALSLVTALMFAALVGCGSSSPTGGGTAPAPGAGGLKSPAGTPQKPKAVE